MTRNESALTRWDALPKNESLADAIATWALEHQGRRPNLSVTYPDRTNGVLIHARVAENQCQLNVHVPFTSSFVRGVRTGGAFAQFYGVAGGQNL
jgi:hypothetical protein